MNGEDRAKGPEHPPRDQSSCGNARAKRRTAEIAKFASIAICHAPQAFDSLSAHQRAVLLFGPYTIGIDFYSDGPIDFLCQFIVP